MLRKVFRTGNSMVVSIPKEALEYLNLSEGVDVSLELDRDNHQITITPVKQPPAIAGVDQNFARQVSEFIEQYRPALEALSK